MLARSAFLLLAIGLTTVSGCGPAKLDVNKTMELDAGAAKPLILDPQPQAQTITVEFESTESSVNVGIFKEEDGKDLDKLDFAKAIKAEKKSKKGSVSAEVPAKTGCRVIVETLAKTSVKLHVTNK